MERSAKQIADLIDALNAQNADRRAVTLCLRHLANMLEDLGDPAASLQVRNYLDNKRKTSLKSTQIKVQHS